MMSKIARNSRGPKIIIFVLAFLLASCGKGSTTATEYLERGKQYFANGEYQAAVIEYKNAVQQDPKNLEARLQLGEYYIFLGLSAAAEKEVKRAIDLGGKTPRSTQILGDTYLLQRKYQHIIDAVAAISPPLSSELLVLRGSAYLGLQNKPEALESFKQAEALSPGLSSAKIGLAKLAVLDGNHDKAFSILDALLKGNTSQPKVWHVKGQIAYSLGKYPQAQIAFEKVIALSPKKVVSRMVVDAEIGLARSLIAQNNDKEAQVVVERLLAKKLNHPAPQYFNAMLAYRAGDFEKAKQNLQDVLRKFPGHQLSNLLLGGVHYARQDFEQAEMYLNRFVTAMPSHLEGRKLLAATRLKQNQPDEALSILSSQIDASSNDIQLLTLVGRAALAGGNYGQAVKYLKKAVSIDPEATSVRAELAKVYMSSGQFGAALEELEQLELRDKKKALMLKVLTLLRKRDNTEALHIAREMVKKSPDDPGTHTLLAGVYLLGGSRQAARDEYAKAALLDNQHIPSRLLLGRLDLEDKKLQDAEHRFDEVLLLDSANIAAMIGHAQVAELNRDNNTVKDWLEKARAVNDKAFLPRFLLAKFYLGMRDAKNALVIADEMEKLQPTNSDMYSLRGEALLALGRGEEAVSVYQEWAQEKPKNLMAHYKLGYAYFANGAFEKAEVALNQSVAIDTKFVPARSLMVLVDLRNNNVSSAKSRIAKIKKIAKKSPVGYVLAGNVAMQEKKYTQAMNEYRVALDKEEKTSTLNKYHLALLRAGKAEKAISESRKWLEKFPDDVAAQLLLAKTYAELDRKTDAEREYRSLLQKNNDSVIVLNNLAWLLFEMKKLNEALLLSEKAYKLAPRNGAVVDTLGWLLVKNGNLSKGGALLEKAAELTKNNPDVNYHLAYVFAEQGKVNKARDLLKEVLAYKTSFQGRADAQRLLDGL